MDRREKGEGYEMYRRYIGDELEMDRREKGKE